MPYWKTKVDKIIEETDSYDPFYFRARLPTPKAEETLPRLPHKNYKDGDHYWTFDGLYRVHTGAWWRVSVGRDVEERAEYLRNLPSIYD